MKALLHPRSARVPPSETLTPTSHKQRPPRVPKENVEPNAMPLESSHFRSPPISAKSPTTRNRSLLPPRPPPSSNPLKRKLSLEALPENGSPALVPCDSGVQVVVRMKPLNNDEEEGNQIAQKISPNSISILDHTFTFDSVADAGSTQQDIFQLVGVPLVENCLAGFNSSIFAYGQTGSGKTYTMWGPPCALAADGLLSQERGLTPRVFELLFSRINEEEAKHSDKQLSYRCRCSFLEIYNEQIIDLLDPSQRNLLIREDVKAGVYVDFLTEDYVCQMKDVVLLLLKGLSNRRIGATSINSESSRSHCVFTCTVECRLKSMADGLSSLRTSRINLVDLAGSERQKATHAAGDRLKEASNINRSLSQLGNIINILAEVSQSGKKYRHIPYRDSRLTFLLQESLGGNAKLAMICAISSSQSCKSETFSTLRFAQRAKAIKNQAVVNETTEDDVNILREEIRQLKDELLRIKSNDPSSDSNKSTGWNVQRSLNLLRLSLCRPRTLPVVKDDSDEEMEIVEEGLEINCVDAHSTFDEDKSSANEEISSLKSLKDSRPDHSDTAGVLNDVYPKQIRGSSIENDQNIWSRHSSVERCEMKPMVADECRAESQGGEMAEIVGGQLFLTELEEGICQDLALRKSLDGSLDISEPCSQVTRDPAGVNVADQSRNSSGSHNHLLPRSLNIVSCEMPLDLPSLTLSNSSVLETCSRKSLRTSLISASQKGISAHLEHDPGVINVSFAGNFKHSNSIVHPPLPGKNSFATTEHLAASLCQGLQVIDSHRHSLSLRNSSFRFSLKTFDLKLLSSMNKVDIGIQTLPQQSNMAEDSTTFICNYCKNKDLPLECNNSTEDAGLQIVPIDDFQPARKSQSVNQCKKLVPKAVEKVLAGAIRREMALEGYCTEQAAEIMHLNRLVQQYRHERECATIIEQTSQDKICRLEGLMDGVIPTEEFMEEEFISLRNEHIMLKGRFQNHPEVFRLNIELKRIQNELDGYRNFFDMGERDVLMEEIQDLRYQLQYFIDSYSTSTCTQSRFLQLAHLTEPISDPLTTICKTKEGADETETISAPLTTICKTKEGADEILEQERRCWTEKESKWISLSEELRTELKASCSLADKLKTELESEKKCTEELKEALQTALEVHTRTLEQYAEFEEKHIALLGRHRKMREGITDVKNAAARAGVKGAGSRFIESLATQIEALRADREKEKRYWRDENKGLQTQLRDTAEAVEAAGELLCRLKEAEQATAAAQKRALAAEQMIEKVYQETDDLKNNYEREIATLNQLLAESRSQRECQNDASSTETGLYSWFHNYDRCNI